MYDIVILSHISITTAVYYDMLTDGSATTL